jgi:hypothetical protein
MTDEVINLCGDTAAQVKAELLDGEELLRRSLSELGTLGLALAKRIGRPRPSA